MLEIPRQKHLRELRHIPDDETVVPVAPRHDLIGRRIINHVVGFAQKRRHGVHWRRYRRRIRVRRRYGFANRFHNSESKTRTTHLKIDPKKFFRSIPLSKIINHPFVLRELKTHTETLSQVLKDPIFDLFPLKDEREKTDFSRKKAWAFRFRSLRFY